MSFIEARLEGQSVPTAWEVPVAAGEEFELGALGTLVDGEFEEAGAGPAAGDVTHVSQTPFGPNTTGFGAIAGRREFPPGMAVVTEVKRGRRFRAEFEGDVPEVRGGGYGAVRGDDGIWRVDFDTPGDLLLYVKPVNEWPDQTPRWVEVEIADGAAGAFEPATGGGE